MKSGICGLLAQGAGGFDPLTRQPGGLGGSGRELAMLLAAVALPVVLFIIWAVFFRKRPKSLSGWRVRSNSSHRSSEEGAPGGSHTEHRRRRRRRREHRPRNPTLAETGGLPPVRSDHESESLP